MTGDPAPEHIVSRKGGAEDILLLLNIIKHIKMEDVMKEKVVQARAELCQAHHSLS